MDERMTLRLIAERWDFIERRGFRQGGGMRLSRDPPPPLASVSRVSRHSGFKYFHAMDAYIVIRTSDDPPVELKASRAVLSVGSKVFADLLSIPRKSGSESSVDVAETAQELKPFLCLLDSSRDKGNPLEELRADDWAVVARLADKYDAAGVRGFALGACWKWASTLEVCSGREHAAAFQTAAALGRARYATHFLLKTLQSCPEEQVKDVMCEREPQFDNWIAKLRTHALEHAVRPPAVAQCLPLWRSATPARPSTGSVMSTSCGTKPWAAPCLSGTPSMELHLSYGHLVARRSTGGCAPPAKQAFTSAPSDSRRITAPQRLNSRSDPCSKGLSARLATPPRRSS
ncbi:hypothetical protein DMC30DRAFT_399052 [Rhodotorula diobovata]|uniref:BTB domain-containing protein n=1 Tax=Rhodotorula diobovata TaxID=5288 RepID=A0A5C5FSV8_9BASI|nr:hypothetical protein DMC30DRAFT_399052 [Rhodotorula diobovata]